MYLNRDDPWMDIKVRAIDKKFWEVNYEFSYEIINSITAIFTILQYAKCEKRYYVLDRCKLFRAKVFKEGKREKYLGVGVHSYDLGIAD